MHPPERSEVSRQTDPVQERSANPRVLSVPQEHRSNGWTSPRESEAPHVPDESTFETFVGGAGI
jgi:hypothetical protein